MNKRNLSSTVLVLACAAAGYMLSPVHLSATEEKGIDLKETPIVAPTPSVESPSVDTVTPAEGKEGEKVEPKAAAPAVEEKVEIAPDLESIEVPTPGMTEPELLVIEEEGTKTTAPVADEKGHEEHHEGEGVEEHKGEALDKKAELLAVEEEGAKAAAPVVEEKEEIAPTEKSIELPVPQVEATKLIAAEEVIKVAEPVAPVAPTPEAPTPVAPVSTPTEPAPVAPSPIVPEHKAPIVDQMECEGGAG